MSNKMGPWTLITILVALLVSAAWSEECNDPCFCPVGKTIADCSNRGLSQPPPGDWPDITILYLRRNNISHLSKESLAGFRNVEVINLERNLLTELDLDAFSDLPFLSELDLGTNAITTIIAPPPGVTIGSLESLNLANNRISSFDPNALLAATDLEILLLDDNPLTVGAGQPILNHPTLLVLQLQSAASLDIGPNTFAGLPMLMQINVYYSGVTSIQGAFVNNPLLSSILLTGNSITEVTEGTFSSGNAIHRLSLSYNPLERLDVAALDNALARGAFLEIFETPLVCNGDYEELKSWAQERGINLFAICLSKKRVLSPKTWKNNEE